MKRTFTLAPKLAALIARHRVTTSLTEPLEPAREDAASRDKAKTTSNKIRPSARYRSLTTLRPAILSAFVLIPGVPASDWHVERYAHIPANAVSVSASEMKISVRESAGPIVYAFHEVRQISGFRVEGKFSALPNVPAAPTGDHKIVDDFPLRIGFVVAGDKRLGWIQRLIAPDWVKHLYASAPEGTGLDRVQFYTLSQRPELVGRTRIHPDSDLVHETFFASVSAPGPFHYDYRLPKALNAVAIWIAMDGDDTHSSYDVTLTDLEIE